MDNPPDNIGVVLGSIGAGAAAGAAVTTAGLIALKELSLIGGDAASFDGPFFILTAGLAAGIVTAATLAFKLAHTIPEFWRRAVTSAIATFGAFMLAGITSVVDTFAGTPGMVVYAAALAVGAHAAVKKARAAATEL